MKHFLWFLSFHALLTAQVPFDRIRVNGDLDRGHWLTYSGNYQGHRYSPLNEINKTNVANLKPMWVYQPTHAGRFETSPILADGVMYITEAPTIVTALDPRTGRSLWRWERTLPEDLQTIGFGRVNRGVAILDDMLYVGTLDAHLVALDRKTGAVRWQTKVADYKVGHCITSAPLAIRGLIITGISGGEAGIRGFLAAYDAKTGKEVWRHWTVPDKGEPGVETWGGESYKTGSGATWVTGSYDPELNTVYWGTGNPGPDWNGDVRPGDNLYTCSLLALDATTGKRKWHFQFTPHDTHDWDAVHVPMLFDATIQGKPRKVVAVANRNAYYYVLDRSTGEYLVGAPYAKQTWSTGLDDKGRPVLVPGKDPTENGNLVWPSLQGATNWFSPSYSPITKYVYVPVREMGSYYFKGEAKFKPGTFFAGGGERALPPDENFGAIRALDAATGAKKWEFRLHQPPWSGVLSTAGGLVFGGSEEGNFYALDALDGKPLWQFQMGGSMAANPVSFTVDGKQRVAMASRGVLMVFGLN
jgi:alcohol dehydrogenase (cytochrome c)